MDSATPQIIKEIAKELESGNLVYMHKKTGQLLLLPDEDSFPFYELDVRDIELKKQLEKNRKNYYEISKWTSSEEFEIMHDFAIQLSESELNNKFLEALNKSKPFKHFKLIIDSSLEHRQKWFEFRYKRHCDYVANQLNYLVSKVN